MNDPSSNDAGLPIGRESADQDDTPQIYAMSGSGGSPTLTRLSFVQMSAILLGAASLSEAARAKTPDSAASKPGAPTGGAQASAHSKAVSAVAFNPAGTLLVSADAGGEIKLWQLPGGALIAKRSIEGPVQKLALEDDRLLWIQSAKGLRAFSLPEITPIDLGEAVNDKISQSRSDVFTVAHMTAGNAGLRPDSERLAVFAGGNEILFAIDVRGSGNFLVLPDKDESSRPESHVTALAASAEGRLCGGTMEGEIRLWEFHGVGSARSRVHALIGRASSSKPSEVAYAFMTPDGSAFFAFDRLATLTKWTLPELKIAGSWQLAAAKMSALALSAQSGQVFHPAGKGDVIAVVELTATSRGDGTLLGHNAPVTALAVSPDGSLLVSGSEDRTIVLWALPACLRIGQLVDLDVNYKEVSGAKVNGVDVYGRSVAYTLPCGSPLPPGAVCTCNCVPGSMVVPENYSRTLGSNGYCTCDTICTCNTVCTCQSVGGRYVSYWYPN